MATMLISLLALICVALAQEYTEGDIETWEGFKAVYGKVYGSPEEEGRRRLIYLNTLDQVRKHNGLYDRGEVSHRLGINHLADLNPEEIPKGVIPFLDESDVCDGQFHEPQDHLRLPEAVDWRTKGVVTEVKDQGACGSCWAFSTTGTLEGQHALKSGELVSLSEQDLVDCDVTDSGCDGGYPARALKYIARHGIDSEQSYPTDNTQGECRFNPKFVAATESGCRQVPPGEEEALKEAVATVGPISVTIDTTGSFSGYTTGVYKSTTCSSEVSGDHAVLIVGYGTTEEGEDYWLVKNSWGPTWGEDGYIKMARNNHNMCGIANTAVYPIV